MTIFWHMYHTNINIFVSHHFAVDKGPIIVIINPITDYVTAYHCIRFVNSTTVFPSLFIF